MATGHEPHHHDGHDSHDLAVALVPAIAEACGGTLRDVRWFRTAQQRGGAATGFATLHRNGITQHVMMKLPIGPGEYSWTTLLSPCPKHEWHSASAYAAITPRVVAGGYELGGHDIAWLVVEKLAPNVSPDHMDAEHAKEMIAACFAFQLACEKAKPLDAAIKAPPSPQWAELIDRGRLLCREHTLAEGSRWSDALRKVHKALPALRNRWEARTIHAWCHGDLHPGNALRRVFSRDEQSREGGLALAPPCVLIDLALVHPGHWMEDALYFERQFWGHSTLLGGVKPVSMLASLRRNAGLSTDDRYTELANIRRILMAACAPAMMQREGNAKYLHTALEMIETLLPQVPH